MFTDVSFVGLAGMLAQTKPAPVCGWGAGLGVWILGSGGPALERKLSHLPSWMTLDNLFLSLSCVLCKRGIVLRIHGITVHLRAATGHGRFSLSEAVWGSDPVGAGAAHSALVEPHQTLIFLLWDFSTYFVPPPFFLLEYSPRMDVPFHHLSLCSNVIDSERSSLGSHLPRSFKSSVLISPKCSVRPWNALLFIVGFHPLHWNPEGTLKGSPGCPCLQEPSTVLPKAGIRPVITEWIDWQ